MADQCRFIQFPHPHREHSSRSGHKWHEIKTKNGNKKPHKRKFMQFQGQWALQDGTTDCAKLWAWGEWEPGSTLIRKLDAPDRWHPRYLWEPHHVQEPSYKGLHSTDPFIFGDPFLYSSCHQANYPKLKQLAPGSVIAFGSGSGCGWMLDTVFVVRKYIDYEVDGRWTKLEGKVPEEFLHVTGGPMLANYGQGCSPEGCAPGYEKLRLYLGASPEKPVNGMFSFFPAKLADGDQGFRRPFISLEDECFNRGNWRTPKGQNIGRSPAELANLWAQLVKQVQDQKLLLGSYAELPDSNRRVSM